MMKERSWLVDLPGGYMNRCSSCNSLFLGHKHRRVCRVCGPEVMKKMVARVKDALDPVVRNIDLGDE